MKFSNESTIMDLTKEVAKTTLLLTGVTLAILCVPKVCKYVDVTIASKAMDATHKAADSVRMLSLAAKYDTAVAKEAMIALPRIMV